VGIKSTGRNVIKYKEKWEKIVKKYHTETEMCMIRKKWGQSRLSKI